MRISSLTPTTAMRYSISRELPQMRVTLMTAEEFRKVLNEHRDMISQHRISMGLDPMTDQEIEEMIELAGKLNRGEIFLPKDVWEL